MHMKRLGLVITVAATIATSGWAQSESMRPLYSRENRFPEKGKVEVGSYFGYAQYDEYFVSQVDPKSYQGIYVDKNANPKLKSTTVEPYAKYGLLENLTVYSKVPFSFDKSDAKNKNYSGFNDIAVGAELLAYEYTYKYPWVIPYVEVTFPSGDDKEHMGNGEVDGIFGVAVGTTTFDKYTWILDGRYDANISDNGRFEGAAAFIWDLSTQFSVLAEAKVTEKEKGSTKDVPLYFNGGLCYRPLEALSVNLYGGTSANAEENGHGMLKVVYSF
ncbi:MAG: transporter [Kiritimatiellaeota bacterium]|nr:transporter [Kiritimatiellota bacterium]